MITSGNQTVGTVSGTATTTGGATTYSGNTTVAPGTSLTADQILQNTLSIGAEATVTIRPSGGAEETGVRGQGSGDDGAAIVAAALGGSGDSDGDVAKATQAALATDTNSSLAIERLQNRIAILGNLAAENPEFDGSLLTAENSLMSLETSIGSSDAENAVSFDPSDSGGLVGGPAAVPEPSTFVLLALAGLLSLLPVLRHRIYGEKLRGGL